jgi:hypothetical protein
MPVSSYVWLCLGQLYFHCMSVFPFWLSQLMIGLPMDIYPVLTNHTISVLVVDARSNSSWSFIADYGPQGELEKKDVYKGVKAAYAAKPDKVDDNGGF